MESVYFIWHYCGSCVCRLDRRRRMWKQRAAYMSNKKQQDIIVEAAAAAHQVVSQKTRQNKPQSQRMHQLLQCCPLCFCLPLRKNLQTLMHILVLSRTFTTSSTSIIPHNSIMIFLTFASPSLPSIFDWKIPIN